MRILAITLALAISGCATQDYQQYASTQTAIATTNPATMGAQIGKITGISIDISQASIATSAGAVLASVQGTLKPGDRCSITAGIARKTPPSSQTYAL